VTPRTATTTRHATGEKRSSDSSRRSIRRQPRIGATSGATRDRKGDAGNLSDAFDDDGLFHFEDTDASLTDAKPNRRKK
jgi:hypothetical protein